MVRGRFITALGGVLGDRRRLLAAGVDVSYRVHQRVADEDVVDELAPAAEAAAEASFLGDQGCEVPQPERIALIGALKAGGVDL